MGSSRGLRGDGGGLSCDSGWLGGDSGWLGDNSSWLAGNNAERVCQACELLFEVGGGSGLLYLRSAHIPAEIVSGEIRNSRHTAMDEASETRELALELALDRASTADVSAAVSDWAQTAAAKTGRKMEERMVNY